MTTEIILNRRVDSSTATDDILRLPFEARQKARQRARAVSGRYFGIKLPRGTILRGGDVLQSECGRTVAIEAAAETVSRIVSDDAQQLARAAYHLGNRHVWVQIGENWLSYLHDHVLDDMLRTLGVSVEVLEDAFEPEAGAYSGGHGHSHTHSHSSDADAGANIGTTNG